MQGANLRCTVHVGMTDEKLPRLCDLSFSESQVNESEFCELCRRIGVSLLLNPGLEHDEQWAQARSLGYGNRANLVIFPYNTPAQTLTCLWADGIYDGIPWTPLFPRRRKR